MSKHHISEDTLKNARAAADRAFLNAAIITAINIGVAMARAKGVVCGSPENIRIRKV